MESDQKWETDIGIGSFLIISDKDKFRHWLISYCSRLVLWELAILRNQFLHPGVTLGQDLKAWEQSRFISEDLRGILLVSRLMILVGSGLPMGPKQILLGWFSSRIIIITPKILKIKAEMRNTVEGIGKRMKSKCCEWRKETYLWNLGDGHHWQESGYLRVGHPTKPISPPRSDTRPRSKGLRPI